MQITFRINYRTNWGESLHITGDIPVLGNSNLQKAPEMKMVSPETWEITLEIPDNIKNFRYSYFVKTDNGRPWRFEWGDKHSFLKGNIVSRYILIDSWQETPPNRPLYSSAFTQGILARECPDPPLDIQSGAVVIKVFAPMIEPWQTLGISGSNDALGNWDATRCLVMNDSGFPEWSVMIPSKDLEVPFNFKFVILDKKTRGLISWEMGRNRIFDVQPCEDKEIVEFSGLRFTNAPQSWKGAGTSVPLFSLRSETDFGIGDLGDLIKAIDWCYVTGQRVLQILPINDTSFTGTWRDSYPYSTISAFALHPMYLDLYEAGQLKNLERIEYFEKRRLELNENAQVDYEAVNKIKQEYISELFEETGDAVLKGKEYKDFLNGNISWLMPYAAFCILRDSNASAEISEWGKNAVYSEQSAIEVCENNPEKTALIYFTQYHLDRQLRKARNYAHSKRIILKGDVPIGMGRNSVDVWKNPHLYNLNCQAGAPPDAFSILGQNWGFPTYNWEEMSKNGFKWWKERFGKMSEYFDAYRIDHILGFFRIWQIPEDALHGLLGYFNPALPFSADELREQYNFFIDTDLQTKPLIMDWMLDDFFGKYTEEAREKFLEHVDAERYRLKDFVCTQKKVAEYFSKEKKSEKNDRLCNALLALIDEVLFIEDPIHKEHYHPRISARMSYQYRRLSEYEKWAFDKLYNDFFYRRHNEFWKGKAMSRLPEITGSTKMLACAEDLGMIPDCVHSVMQSLQILSLKVQRMPEDSNVEFANTACYPYYSVCTTSTHDMPGIRSWWEEDHSASQRYYNNVLGEPGEAPLSAESDICSRIIDFHLKSPSMLCIIPLQDWLSTDSGLRHDNPAEEIINVPSNPKHYWRYRMHLTLESLLDADKFNRSMYERIKASGR